MSRAPSHYRSPVKECLTYAEKRRAGLCGAYGCNAETTATALCPHHAAINLARVKAFQNKRRKARLCVKCGAKLPSQEWRKWCARCRCDHNALQRKAAQ